MTDHPITMTDPEAALWTELDDLRSRLAKAEIERDEHATDARYLREIIADLREEHAARLTAQNTVIDATATVLLDSAAQVRAYLAEGRTREVDVLISLLTGGIARPEVTRA